MLRPSEASVIRAMDQTLEPRPERKPGRPCPLVVHQSGKAELRGADGACRRRPKHELRQLRMSATKAFLSAQRETVVALPEMPEPTTRQVGHTEGPTRDRLPRISRVSVVEAVTSGLRTPRIWPP